MLKEYEKLARFLIVIVISLAAVLVPFVPLKIILGSIAIFLYAMNIKRFSTLFIVLAVIFVIIPVLFLALSRDYNLVSRFFNSSSWRYIYFSDWESEYSHEGYTVVEDGVLLPALSYRVSGGALNIIFSSDENNPRAMGKVAFKKKGDVNNISALDYIRNTSEAATILLPRGERIEILDMQNSAVSIKGEFYAQRVSADTQVCTLDATLTAEKTVILVADDLKAKGTIKAEKMIINGNICELDLNVSEVKTFNIDSLYANGRIKYTDGWEGVRILSISSNSGRIEVMQPRNNEGTLDIRTQDGVTVLSTLY